MLHMRQRLRRIKILPRARKRAFGNQKILLHRLQQRVFVLEVFAAPSNTQPPSRNRDRLGAFHLPDLREIVPETHQFAEAHRCQARHCAAAQGEKASLRHLRQELRRNRQAAHSLSHSHGGQALLVLVLRQEFLKKRLPGHARTYSHGGEAVLLRLLREMLQSELFVADTRQKSYRGAAVRLSVVSGGFYEQGRARFAFEDVRRRILLTVCFRCFVDALSSFVVKVC